MSPVYDFLETNIPHTLMNYTDKAFPEGASLFPPHKVVLEYIQDYAKDMEQHISYQTQIVSVTKTQSNGRRCWEVESKDLTTKTVVKCDYDAIAVASGHYNDPFVPDIAGLQQFNERYPGSISHSKFYRRPDHYKDKVLLPLFYSLRTAIRRWPHANTSLQKVVVVGNSASGIDISVQISSVAKLPIFISEKEKNAPSASAPKEDKPWARDVPEIAELLPAERAVRFANGHVETEVDSVIFCTGYHYSFPFLRGLEPSIMVPDGSHAAHLWEHLLYTADPSLAFLSIPQRIVPFPVAEAQGAVIARIWSDRLNAPTASEREEWVCWLEKEKGKGKALHNLATPKDVEYINRLHALSEQARRAPERRLENDGKGKAPPYWGPDKAWVRERLPFIKLASRALGERRHTVKTMKQLGFDYDEWKKEAQAGEKLL